MVWQTTPPKNAQRFCSRNIRFEPCSISEPSRMSLTWLANPPMTKEQTDQLVKHAHAALARKTSGLSRTSVTNSSSIQLLYYNHSCACCQMCQSLSLSLSLTLSFSLSRCVTSSSGAAEPLGRVHYPSSPFSLSIYPWFGSPERKSASTPCLYF